ncbi:DUF1826 domain-containing protein [Pseudoalteromonas piscicida]|uniref:DUF1826 domain-containing protein n=1 Tax=Pseudoalteromonas piscicida TaxID=43662 RepID=UPI00309F92D4
MNNDLAQNSATQMNHYQCADQVTVLTKIYQADCNLAVWQQALSQDLKQDIRDFLETTPNIDITEQISTSNIAEEVTESLKKHHFDAQVVTHIVSIIDMFSCLFELRIVGLRLKTLHSAMCPKFHVDKVPVRLVTTLAGAGSEWLANSKVKRENNTLIIDHDVIAESLECGDVALLKGERWAGNEGRGLVHRSPKATQNQKRLLLTLDFIA